MFADEMIYWKIQNNWKTLVSVWVRLCTLRVRQSSAVVVGVGVLTFGGRVCVRGRGAPGELVTSHFRIWMLLTGCVCSQNSLSREVHLYPLDTLLF